MLLQVGRFLSLGNVVLIAMWGCIAVLMFYIQMINQEVNQPTNQMDPLPLIPLDRVTFYDPRTDASNRLRGSERCQGALLNPKP